MTPTTSPFYSFRRAAAILLLVGGGIFAFSGISAAEGFRLSDGTAEDELKGSPASPAPTEESGDLFEFNQNDWNKARDSVEAMEHPKPSLAVSTAPASLPVEAPPGINVDLPYESGLTISGRKLIALKLTQMRRKSAQRASDLGLPQNQNTMEMRQELQVRIKGKVGRKITVNVDFDDTKDDKKDISVMYQGDPGEFVQEAAFGDITLSVPSTEFVSFSKQLFGVRTKLQYKNASLMAIGSRTKGTTETKRFNGATKFERRVIPGSAYYRRQYYSVAFTTRPIAPGTETVWRDDGNPTNDNPPLTQFLTVEDFDSPISTTTGMFDKLKPGDDYTFDAARGLLFFKRPVDAAAVIAVDYAFLDGTSTSTYLSALQTPGRLKVVKTANDIPLSVDPAATAHKREVKTFYSFGNIRLVHDNGAGNFILRTIDGNQNEKRIPLTSNDFLQYRSSDTATDKSTIQVDYELGVFNILYSTGRFDPDNYLRVADSTSTLYAPTPTSDFSFLTEYKYRLRDFQLRPNIVFNSERVSVNGRLMKSEIDYFLDPASGLLQFFNDNELDDNSQIEVTYDYAPFGGQLGQTLVGGRAELAVVPGRFNLGSTFLYTFAPKTTVVPDVRSTPSSLMVMEMDGRMTDVSVPFTDLKMSFSGEAAQSREDPNLYGKALVDSMEGSTQEDAMVLDPKVWPLGANPDDYIHDSIRTPTRPDSLSLNAADVDLRDVVSPEAGVQSNEKLRVMDVTINNLSRKAGDPSAQEESSLIQALPNGGNRDYSKKLYLEMWLEGFGDKGKDVDLWVNAGRFNEDADLDGIADTEDKNLDGTLNEGEDVGYEYDYGTSSVRIGAGNGRIDAENVNGGVFYTNDQLGFGSPLLTLKNLPSGSSVTDRYGNSAPINDLGFDGWRFIRVPLSAVTSNPNQYTNVEQIRLTFVAGPSTTPYNATLRIGKLAFVGNTWEKPVVSAGASMNVGAVNNLDDPDYESLIGNAAYNDLYGDPANNRSREQALALGYTLPVGSTATTRSLYGTARDFSHHKNLNFFVRRAPHQPEGGTLVFQFGSETDYFQYTRPIDNTTVGWNLDTLHLVDRNSDGTPETVQSDVIGSSVTVVGSPSLSRIGQIKIGIRNDTASPLSGVLWINEIHLSESRTRVGNARRFTTDGKWGKWGTFGGTFRNVDRNFQTLTSPVVNQDRQEISGYGNFSRFSFMPLSGKYTHSKTLTPAALQTGQSQLVSVLSEGREESIDARGDGQFIFPKWPAFSYSAERALNESTTNMERRDRNLYSGSLDYAVPGRFDILPGKFTFRPLPESVFLKYSRSNFFLSYFPERLDQQISASTDPVSQRNAVFANARVSEFTDDWVGRMGFTPWDGLVLTPNYSQHRVSEKRDFTEAQIAANPDFSAAQGYDKSFSQTRGLAGSWRIFSWLEPRLTYSQTGTETNGLPTASSTTASNVKALDRSASGDLFLSLAPRDLFPKLKIFKSLNMDGSFRVESADTYANVPKDFTDWRKVTLFEVSHVTRRDGSRMFSLLSPLDTANSSAQRNQMTARNTLRYALNWSPLDWLNFPYRMEPFKTTSLNNTLTITDEHTENTLTARDIKTQSWPDMILTMRDIEKLLFVEKWVGGSQTNVRYTLRTAKTFQEDITKNVTEGVDQRFTLFSRYDIFMSFSSNQGKSKDLNSGLLKSTSRGYNDTLQVGVKLGSWRLTPSAGMRSDTAKDGTGRFTQDLQTLSGAIQGRFDKSYPGGFRLPFTKKILANVNRLTLDTKLTYDRRTSSLNYVRDNTDTYSADATGEWEISKNFRFSFGGKLGLVNNRASPQDGYMSAELNSQLVIQF